MLVGFLHSENNKINVLSVQSRELADIVFTLKQNGV